MNKKGFFMDTRDWISLFVGLVIFALGIIPLLNTFGVIGFGLPSFLTGFVGSVFGWVIAVAALYILIDGLIEPAGHMLHMAFIGLGLLFFVVGLLPILYTFGVIGFSIPFLDNLVVYNIIITLEGIMLMTAGFTMR